MVRTDGDRVPATFKVMVPLFECRNNREHLGIICFNLFLQAKVLLVSVQIQRI